MVSNLLLGEELSNQKQDARARILKVALKAFAMRGLHGVSTLEIAKASAVTQPLIHYHFKTKEALWRAAVEQAFGWFKKDLDDLLKHSSDLRQEDLLIAFVKTLIAFSAKHPEVGQFLLREGMQDSDRLNWMAETLLQPAFEILSVYYQQGIAENWLEPLPFAELSVMLMAMTTQFFALSPMIMQVYGIDSHDSQHIDKLTDLMVQFVRKLMVKS